LYKGVDIKNDKRIFNRPDWFRLTNNCRRELERIKKEEPIGWKRL